MSMTRIGSPTIRFSLTAAVDEVILTAFCIATETLPTRDSHLHWHAGRLAPAGSRPERGATVTPRVAGHSHRPDTCTEHIAVPTCLICLANHGQCQGCR